MKRGLKVAAQFQIIETRTCVATYAPMKRGLKVIKSKRKENSTMRSNLCPDEKGTESRVSVVSAVPQRGSNLCPDEKGTERFLSLSMPSDALQ